MQSMAFKRFIKKIIGKKGTAILKTICQRAKYIYGFTCHDVGRIETGFPYKMYKQVDKHLFFGYYDLQQMNGAQDKLLAHRLAKDADPACDSIDIGWIDRTTEQFYQIAQSSAWCWQQGSRLRWHPIDEKLILFNNLQNDSYCTEIWDTVSGQKRGSIPCAFYDVTPDFAYGLSLNFSRLQRLRPGYGYETLPDITKGEKAPENDGVFRYEIASGRKELLVSLRQLAVASGDVKEEYQHYINHISVAPDGKHFMFLHLWTKGANEPWKVEMYTMALSGEELKRLESKANPISHYCWKNERVLLTTTSEGVYAEYDISTGKRITLDYPELKNDGHPAYFSDKERILADSYPLKRSMQHLFMISRDGKNYREIASLFSDPRMFGEKRCDLHPRLTKDNRIITIDSTVSGKYRCVIEWKI